MNTQPLYGAFFFAGFYWIPNLVWATGFYAIGLAVPTGGVG